jgi:hypothetical protein
MDEGGFLASRIAQDAVTGSLRGSGEPRFMKVTGPAPLAA